MFSVRLIVVDEDNNDIGIESAVMVRGTRPLTETEIKDLAEVAAIFLRQRYAEATVCG